MALILAAVLYGAFFLNVVLGAFFRAAVLSDVGELLVMFAASFAFVVGILIRERQALKNS